MDARWKTRDAYAGRTQIALAQTLFEGLLPLLAVAVATVATSFCLGMISGDPVFFWIAGACLVVSLVRFGLYAVYKRRNTGLSLRSIRRWTLAYGVSAISYAVILAMLIWHGLRHNNVSTNFAILDVAVLYASQVSASAIRTWIGLVAGIIVTVTTICGIVLGGGGPIMWGLGAFLSLFFFAYARSLANYQKSILQRMDAQRNLAFMTHHDSLTRLANRSYFGARLDEEISAARASNAMIAMHYIDLDHFKRVNDTRGMAFGDALLCKVANALRAACPAGAIPTRVGGDEFVVIQTALDSELAALGLAERLCTTLSAVGHDCEVTASIGTAVFPKDAADADSLAEAAHTALYQAKQAGRATYRSLDSRAAEQQRRRQQLEQDLRQAVTAKKLDVVYQPQSDVAGKRLLGFEALIRWTHPTLGPVPPVDFIPIAEESHLIHALGIFVLERACQEAASWSRPLSVAVNLSPLQIVDRQLASTVKTILDATGLHPSRLELEITEGVFIQDTERTLRVLNELKEMGLRIVMDDFGTGYSSLSYLQTFPFDKLKIDRSFVINLDRNRNSLSIVRAITSLGAGLGIPVLAEGVETATQRLLLEQEGCTEIQGYYIGRPSPIEAFRNWLESDEAPSVTDAA